jgi:VWFA-related protein
MEGQMSIRRLSTILAVTPVAATLLLFAQPGGAQAPRFQSGVDVVVVDVTIIGSDGNPIATLTKPDFVLTVDGKPRDVVSVVVQDYRAVASGGAAAPGADAAGSASGTPARAPERRFLLLVDRATLGHGDWRKALKGARSFVDSLPSGDGVGVAMLPASNLTLRFDQSREAVKKELEKPLRSSFGWEGEAQPTLQAQWSVDDMLYNIESVVHGLSRLDGPKHLVLVGAPLLVCETRVPGPRPVATAAEDRAGQASPAAQLQAQQALEQATAAARQAGQTQRASSMLIRTRAIADAAGLGRVRIHTLTLGDSSGWSSPSTRLSNNPEAIDAAAERSVGLGTNNLASATGGLALFPVTADTFFNRLSRELSVSYALAFAPQPGDDDGKPHRIEVKVPTAGRVTVRARDEFVVPTGALKTTR